MFLPAGDSAVACALAGSLGPRLDPAVCGISLGIVTTALHATAQTLAGRKAAGRWTGVQNSFGNLAGIAAPVLTGVAVDQTGAFSLGFLIPAALALVCWFAYGVIVRRIEPIDWPIASRLVARPL